MYVRRSASGDRPTNEGIGWHVNSITGWQYRRWQRLTGLTAPEVSFDGYVQCHSQAIFIVPKLIYCRTGGRPSEATCVELRHRPWRRRQRQNRSACAKRGRDGRNEGRRKDSAAPSIAETRTVAAAARRWRGSGGAPADGLRNVDLFSVSSCFEVLMPARGAYLVTILLEVATAEKTDWCERGIREEWERYTQMRARTHTHLQTHTRTYTHSRTQTHA